MTNYPEKKQNQRQTSRRSCCYCLIAVEGKVEALLWLFGWGEKFKSWRRKRRAFRHVERSVVRTSAAIGVKVESLGRDPCPTKTIRAHKLADMMQRVCLMLANDEF